MDRRLPRGGTLGLYADQAFLFSVARTCSIIFIVLDVLKPLQHKKIIEHEMEGFGIRLNKKPPNIGFRKKDKGGINFTVTVRFASSCNVNRKFEIPQFAVPLHTQTK